MNYNYFMHYYRSFLLDVGFLDAGCWMMVF